GWAGRGVGVVAGRGRGGRAGGRGDGAPGGATGGRPGPVEASSAPGASGGAAPLSRPPRADLPPVSLLVGEGELPEPDGDGERVRGVGERPRRQLPERAHEPGASPREPPEQPWHRRRPGGADGPRVVPVRVG